MNPTLVVHCALAILSLWRVYRTYIRWSSLDFLPGPPSSSLLFGNMRDISGRQNWKRWRYFSETYGPASKLTFLLGARCLHVYDPKALHTILVKHVDLFPKSIAPLDFLRLLLGDSILTTKGNTHRRQRKMLNPVFSVAHLRNMAHLFYKIAHQVEKAIGARVADGPTEVDMNGWMARTTLEMLGEAGLGYSFDDFSKDSTDVYGESLKMFFPAANAVPFLGISINYLSHFFSRIGIWRVLRAVPLAKLQQVLNISDLMAQRSREIVAEKKTALQQGDQELAHRVGEGKDIMSILLKANTAASESEKLTDAEVVAQMSTFTLAGMDTTSNALSRALHLLAQHPDVQEKLRAEIVEAKGGNGSGTDIDHDELIKLPYLDAVCRETLRLYTPAPLTTRRSAQDVVLPLSAPIRARDGSYKSEIFVPKGTLIFLNLQASNVSKALWGEDALEWRPERWLEPLPKEVEEARIPGVYSNLMTFLGGTHSCIGFKFSQLEMKVLLAVLLASFKFGLSESPIVWNSSAVIYPTMGEESTKPEMALKVSTVCV